MFNKLLKLKNKERINNIWKNYTIRENNIINKNIKDEKNNNIKYKAKTIKILSIPEQILYSYLLKIQNNINKEKTNWYERIRIYPKIRVADILECENNEIKNKTFGMHFDYIICNYKYELLLIIELDDKSHYNNKKTIESDKLKNIICEKNNINLYRIKEKYKYDINELYNKIKEYIE